MFLIQEVKILIYIRCVIISDGQVSIDRSIVKIQLKYFSYVCQSLWKILTAAERFFFNIFFMKFKNMECFD